MISYWDGKTMNFGVSVSKIRACAKFIGVGDVFDPILQEQCPTWLEFAAIDVTKPDN